MSRRIIELDGLRALACGAVLLAHTGLPGTGGGFLGVDLFFVLSGFLITGLLVGEVEETGGLRVGAFWLRRTARLYPALLLTLGLCGVLALAVPGFPVTWSGALFAATYTMDGARAVHAGGGALAHTWSLAVEEQFYLVWPLVVVALRRRRALLVLCVAGGAVSLACASALGYQAAYYAPHARAFELLAGCALALLGRRLPAPRLLLAGGAALFLVAVATSDVTTSYGRHTSLLAGTYVATIAGVLLVAGAGAGEGRAAALLRSAPLVALGRISYGVYLFHFPLTLAAKQVAPGSVAAVLAAEVVAVGLAAASDRWLEEPCRAWARRCTQARPVPATTALQPASGPAIP